MSASIQPHASATLIMVKELLVPIGQKAGWATEHV